MEAEHAGQSGMILLRSGLDAFVSRLAVADAAERSLDIQYYIWHGDVTGWMLAQRLIAAADRGVRVRLLLDDFGKTASDAGLLALDANPNIEVRLFNPMAFRGARVLGMLPEFSRTTRRMHNKSFTADNQISIIGGRNIGDEYFSADPAVDFADLDALVIGPVVHDISGSFDLYWNSPGAFSIEALSGRPASANEIAHRRARFESSLLEHKDSPFARAVRETALVDQIRSQQISFSWGAASVVYDDPDKAARTSDDSSHQLMTQLRPTLDSTQRELVMVTAYFVPGRAGVEFFRELRRRGVRVVVLTNSLASTDALAVHAGYSRYRKALLRAGVELYELKPTARLVEPRSKGVGSWHRGNR